MTASSSLWWKFGLDAPGNALPAFDLKRRFFELCLKLCSSVFTSQSDTQQLVMERKILALKTLDLISQSSALPTPWAPTNLNGGESPQIRKGEDKTRWSRKDHKQTREAKKCLPSPHAEAPFCPDDPEKPEVDPQCSDPDKSTVKSQYKDKKQQNKRKRRPEMGSERKVEANEGAYLNFDLRSGSIRKTRSNNLRLSRSPRRCKQLERQVLFTHLHPLYLLLAETLKKVAKQR